MEKTYNKSEPKTKKSKCLLVTIENFAMEGKVPRQRDNKNIISNNVDIHWFGLLAQRLESAIQCSLLEVQGNHNKNNNNNWVCEPEQMFLGSKDKNELISN